MAERRVSIPNISCGHCVKTIERELGEVDGVLDVKGDAATREVSISWNEDVTTWDELAALLVEIRYPPAG